MHVLSPIAPNRDHKASLDMKLKFIFNTKPEWTLGMGVAVIGCHIRE
jgi:hypothetical protein